MIIDNLRRIRERVIAACAKVKRSPDSIKIVCVTKGRTTGQIKEAIEAGLNELAENRVQEAALKFNSLRAMNYELRTHMLGHLQTNKVKEAVKIFDLIQSVDSLHLAQEIDKEALKINKVQQVLLEVKTSPEAAKFGLKPEETAGAVKEISKLKNISIQGLMTIAPLADNPEQARAYFRLLRELKEKISQLLSMDYGLWTLSMGMTDDFEVAIEEGSNMVRLGRAIFENNNL